LPIAAHTVLAIGNHVEDTSDRKLASASGARSLVKNPSEIAPVGCRFVIRCDLARQASGRVPPGAMALVTQFGDSGL
jgi:hypothetical protein